MTSLWPKMVDMKVAGCKVEVSKSKIKILKLDVFHSSRWHIFYVTITYLDLNKGGEPRSTWSVASTLQCCHHQVLVIEVGCYIMFFFPIFHPQHQPHHFPKADDAFGTSQNRQHGAHLREPWPRWRFIPRSTSWFLVPRGSKGWLLQGSKPCRECDEP